MPAGRIFAGRISLKQYNYELKGPGTLKKAVAEMKERMKKEDGNLFIMFFHAGNDPAIIASDLKHLSCAFPGVPISGMNNSGGIMGGHRVLGNSVLSFLLFKNTEMKLFVYDMNSLSIKDAAEKALADFQKIRNLAGVEILISIEISRMVGFFDVLDRLSPSVAVFGGAADSYTPGSTAYIFAGEKVLTNAIVCLTFAGDVTIDVHMNLGWQPLGRYMTVTAMEGDTILKELDHRPAAEIYAKYLNIKNTSSFGRDVLSFPLILIRDDHMVARLPDGCRPDGALVMGGNVFEGEKCRLAYGDPNEIIRRCQESTRKIADFGAEGILIFSCITRRIFLKEDSDRILAPYEAIAPASGGYCHGEISRRDGKTSGLNMTLVAAAFREKNGPERPAAYGAETKNIVFGSDKVTTIQRLASFVTVSSSELEETNRKLEEANEKLEKLNGELAEANARLSYMASHDGLTDLFNREIMEKELHRLMRKNRSGEINFCAIMVDLDDFKKINDTFGHDEGDRVLKELAGILKEKMPENGMAGRWGGDEFVALLPDSGREEALKTAEWIRSSVLNRISRCDGEALSVSLGIAESTGSEHTDSFYRRLDNALYRAKKSGKNAIVVME